MPKSNMEKTPPKGSVRFSLSLSPEQKKAKTEILKHTLIYNEQYFADSGNVPL